MDVVLDQSGAIPLTAQVRLDLVRRIMSGQYGLGEKIPSLRGLAAEYGIAEMTVYSAVKQLQHEGVLESASGRGTFVRKVPDSANAPSVDAVDEVADLRAELAELRMRVEALEASRDR